MKMTIKKLECLFSFDENNIPELNNYGVYRMGLTSQEIKDYIRVRAGKMEVKILIKKFNDICGVNTLGSYGCPSCDYYTFLMYRHDVLRFADQLFNGTHTYWD